MQALSHRQDSPKFCASRSAMLFLAGLLLHLLAFGTLVAPVFSLQFNIAMVQQCAPILLSFSGLTSPLPRAPASLTILPFNSTAILVPLENPNVSAGIDLNFLPLAADSQFIVSLDDVDGSNIIDISNIVPVLPSPDGNSICVPQQDAVPLTSFTLASPVSQCQNFTINYNTTLISQAPFVRLFSPGGPAFLLNATSDNPLSGVATYIMAFSYGREIVLLMDDGNGIQDTSALLTVGGNSSSLTHCLSAHATSTLSGDSGTGFSSRPIIISGAIIGGVAVLLGIWVAILFFRDRRRCRRMQRIQFDKTVRFEKNIAFDNEKDTTIPQVIVLDDPFPTGFVTNPVKTLYPVNTSNGFLSSIRAVYERNSLASWSQAIPEDQRPSTLPEEKQSPTAADRSSAHFLDIEAMLNPLQRVNPDPVVSGSSMVEPPLQQPSMIFRSPSGRHLRAPSDVPADLNPRGSSYSTISTNPFHSFVTLEESSPLRTPIAPSLTRGRSINGGFVGLPSSPRDGSRTNLWRAPSKRSNISTAEWNGGIAH